MADTELKPFLLYLPADLKKRSQIIAKRHHMTISHMCREGLRRFCEEFEQKEVEESQRQRQLLDDKRERRKANLGALAPVQRDLSPQLGRSARKETPPAVNDDIDTLYQEHGARIAEVVGTPLECQLRTREAVRDIQSRFPITHPGAAEILRKLEIEIVRLRKPKSVVESQPVSTLDTLVDRLLNRGVDTSKTKTTVLSDISSEDETE